MKISSNIIKLLLSLYKSIKRFPFSIALSTAFVIVMIISSEIKPLSTRSITENLDKISMILALGFPLSICIKLYFEKKEIVKLVHILIAFMGEGFILVFYYYFFLKDFSMVSTSRYVGINLILYLSFIFIPYFKNKENFELYVTKIFGRFFITIIYSIVLYAGLCSILATIDKLLEIKVPSDFYYYTFLIVAGIFSPTYYLGWLPSIKDKFTKENYSNIFKILVLYIVMPLITIYTIILYIYFAKIIITVKWPVGLVSHLVLWYSVISASVLFFISPIYKENNFSNKFMKLLPKSILPLMILMFFSIAIRINAYGITENRYYVIALSFWVFGVMIYFSLTKNFKNIFLPVTLSIIIFISVLGGPLSSYKISILSQNLRLEKILINNNMLKDNNIIKSSSISETDKNEINSILNYFNKDHNLSDIKYLPKNFKNESMVNVFGFASSSNSNYSQTNFSFNSVQAGGPIDVTGYDYIFDSRNNYDQKNNSKLNINYDKSLNTLKVLNKNIVIYSKNFNSIFNKLVDKFAVDEKQNNIDQNDMFYQEETPKVKIKFFITSLYGTKNSSTQFINVNDINYYIIIKLK